MPTFHDHSSPKSNRPPYPTGTEQRYASEWVIYGTAYPFTSYELGDKYFVDLYVNRGSDEDKSAMTDCFNEHGWAVEINSGTAGGPDLLRAQIQVNRPYELYAQVERILNKSRQRGYLFGSD